MTRWRAAFDRIGGPDAVTWAAFWITYATSIAGHLANGGPVTASIGTRLLAVTISQVAMFVPLVALRMTVLRHPPRPRPWVAVGGFVAAAVTRGAVLAAVLLALGAVDNPLWTYRIAASLVGTAAPLVMIAIVVSTTRTYSRSLQDLAAIQGELERMGARIAETVNERNDELITGIQQRLRTEFAGFGTLDGPSAAAELQRLASDVVRPMSHAFATPTTALATSPVPDDTAHVGWRQMAEQMADGVSLRPMLSAAFIACLMITASVGTFGIRGIALTAAVSVSLFLTAALANTVFRRLLPGRSPLAALASVSAAAVVVGFASASAGSLTLGSTDLARVFFLAAGSFISAAVLLIAGTSATLSRQRESEQLLRTSTEALQREVVRLRQVQWLQQKAISRALHGPVQTAVTAAALRIDAAVRAGEPTGVLVDATQRELQHVLGTLDILESETPDLTIALARICGIWEGMCTVTAKVDDTATVMLATDPVAATMTVDMLTEAVSNAIRHGEASSVSIVLSVADPQTMLVQVSDNGQAVDTPERRRGLGTNLLDDCSLNWSRTATTSGHVLTAAIPVQPASTQADQTE